MSDQGPSPEAVRLHALSVEMADRVSARRGQANQFYLSVQTLLLGAPALLSVAVSADSDPDPARLTVLASIGVFVSAAWWLQLRSYRQLNAAKFNVINAIEQEHFTIRPFSDEWDTLKGDGVKRWRDRYAELSTVERVLPVLFAIANVVVGVWAWL